MHGDWVTEDEVEEEGDLERDPDTLRHFRRGYSKGV